MVEDLRGRLSVLDGPEKEAFIGASRKATLAIKKVFGLKKKEIQDGFKACPPLPVSRSIGLFF